MCSKEADSDAQYRYVKRESRMRLPSNSRISVLDMFMVPCLVGDYKVLC